MSDTGNQDDPAKEPQERGRARPAIRPLLLAAPLAFVAMLVVAAIPLAGRPIMLPAWVSQKIESRIAKQIGDANVRLSGAELELGSGGLANLILRDISLQDERGASLGQVNRLSVGFTPGSLLRGTAIPSRLAISGAQVTIRRGADGSFLFSLGGGAAATGENLGQALGMIDAFFDKPPFAEVARVETSDVTITLEDARSGRIWQATNGKLNLTNADDRVDIDVFSEVFNGTENLAQVAFSFSSEKGSPRSVVSVTLQNAAAQDIAVQSPVLSYLEVLDAPVSGAIRASFDEQAGLETLAATLDLGQGELRPDGIDKPVGFNRGRLYLTYDAASQRIEFSEIAVAGDKMRVVADGHALFGDFVDGWPGSMTTQLRVSEVEFVAEDMFDEPVRFDAAYADLRLGLRPFRVDVGQISLERSGERIRARGRITGRDAGWHIALDAQSDLMGYQSVLALWPKNSIAGTRNWLIENLGAGLLSDVQFSLRARPGEKVVTGLTYNFSEAEVRVLPHFPPIRAAQGHASLAGDAYSMALAEGHMDPVAGGAVDLAGSSIRISELSSGFGMADIRLTTDSTLQAALTLLDNKPLRVLEKSGLDAEVADARARLAARIGFELAPVVAADAVEFRVSGTLENVSSRALIPNRLLEAGKLGVSVDPEQLILAGTVDVDGFPFDATFRQPLGAGPIAPGHVEGSFALGQQFLTAFGIELPKGSVRGTSEARFVIDLPKDAPPDFRMDSTVKGMRLAVSALGWSKPPGAKGVLEVEGRLGPIPEISHIALEAPGITAKGSISFAEGGKFQAADFEKVRALSWFDAPVRLEATAPGRPPRVIIAGGVIDLRKRPEPADGTGGGGAVVPVALQLDRLVVTKGLAITAAQSDLKIGNGLSGQFTGRVNGGTPIRGVIENREAGPAIIVRGDDAGGALRDAGFFKSARSGSFEVVLLSRPDGPGFNGTLNVKETRLSNQPVIMDLLDAVSIVGIIDQLRGAGILFDDVQAKFRLRPGQFILDEGSAVGASLGVSLDGTYDLNSRQLNLQGVLSPIYVLNVVGRLFAPRRGEGLFGFTFRVEGEAAAPQIRVNPLSVFTPGMFREIFRRAPPGRDK